METKVPEIRKGKFHFLKYLLVFNFAELRIGEIILIGGRMQEALKSVR